MFKFLFFRPVSVIVIFLGFIVLGILAVLKMPVSALPDIQFPEISIRLNLPGESARSIDNNNLKDFNQQLQQIYGLKAISSESSDGTATIRLKFNFGADLDRAFIEVNEKLELAMASFPKGTDRPRVLKSSATDLPVFFINLSLKGAAGQDAQEEKFLELSEFAAKVVKRRLEQLPEIAFADLTGAAKKILSITPKKDVTYKFGLNEDDIKQVLDENLTEYGTIDVTEGGGTYSIEVKSENANRFSDLEKQKLNYHGRLLAISELFDIRISKKNREGVFLSNNHNALSFAVIKQPEASLTDLRTATVKTVKELSVLYPDIDFQITQDQTSILEYALSALKQDLIAGSLLAFIILLVFFADLRRALLIFITIPVSLLISMLFFHLAGITLNIISLAGLIVGVGLMIDNSIIVIDSISSKLESLKIEDACVKGVELIFRPMLASAFTTCSVFLPLIFLSGIAGALFYDQAISVCIALFTSVIVTTVLLPILFKLTHSTSKSPRSIESVDRRFNFFQSAYKKGFSFVFDHKYLSVTIAAILVVFGFALFAVMPRERMPRMTEGEYEVSIRWRDNISIEENIERTIDILKALPGNRLVSSARVGHQQFMLDHERSLTSCEAQIYFKASSESEGSKAAKLLISYAADKYPGVNITIGTAENIFEQVLGKEVKDLTIKVGTVSGTSPSIAQVESVWQIVKQNFPKLQSDRVPLSEATIFTIDRIKAERYGADLPVIESAVRKSVETRDLGIYGTGNSQESVVYTARPVENIYEILASTPLKNSSGKNLVLSDLIKVSRSEDFQRILSEDDMSYIPILVNVSEATAVKECIVKNLKDKDIVVTYYDKHAQDSKLIREMLLVMSVAVLLLYFILAAQFDSLLQPLIVLCELPIGVFGALVMMWAFGATINLMSLIGMVVMCGIIINDSILKVDAINQMLKTTDLDLLDVISIAGKGRLKSIVMTAMVTIISVIPFFFGSDIASNLQRPLSLAIVGGMVVGTPVSLYILPLLFWFCYKNKQKHRKDRL